jgi:putative polyhydroxyalkanoate system protein
LPRAASGDIPAPLASGLANWHHCGFLLTEQEGKSMADINIVQQHSLGMDAARAAAQKVADKLAGEFGLACRWDGDVLRFARNGVEGALTLGEARAAMVIKLGFFASAFAPAIEAKVHENMRKVFA